MTASIAAAAPSTTAPIIMPAATTGPGNFNITNTDVSQMVSQEMAEYFERQKGDKAFFVQSINEIENAANKINSGIVIGQLQAASQQSQLMTFENPKRGNRPGETGAIQVDSFFSMMNNYNAAKQVLQNKIKGIQAMSKGALPSASSQVTEGKDLNLPAHLNVDFEKIAGYYNNRITEMDAQINEMNFKVKDKGGVIQDVSGFRIDPSKMNILTNEERSVRQTEIDRLRTNLRALDAKQDQYTATARELVQTHLFNFGSSERFRSLNEKDIEARKKDYQRLAELFWARSYLRQKYGIPLGAIGTTYKKQFFNIEEFLKNPSQFIELNKMSFRSKKDLLRAEESYRNAASVIDKKAASVFDGNYSLLARANSLLTKATGWGPMAESSAMVLRLLAADVAEELALMEPGGQQKVRDSFRKRHLSDAESMESTRRLLCSYDPSAQPAGKCSGALASSPIEQDRRTGGDPMTMFRDLVHQSDLQLGAYTQARRLQEQLDSMTNLKDNPINKEIIDGNSALWSDQKPPSNAVK